MVIQFDFDSIMWKFMNWDLVIQWIHIFSVCFQQTQNEFKLQEDMFKSMNTQGNQLLLRADDTAQEELRVSMAQIQQHWHQIYVKLDGERERLEGVLKQWQECEEDIEEILTWLKDTRKALTGGLPTAYEELQADMHRCKVWLIDLDMSHGASIHIEELVII